MTKQNNENQHAQMSNHMQGDEIIKKKVTPKLDSTITNQADAVAIIGIAGFFPGADSIEDFCQKLVNQASLFSTVPANHFPDEDMQGRYGAFLAEIAKFDPEVFNIGPMEAKYMDPRTRLLLMSVWHTLEDACYLPNQLQGAKVDVHIASEGAPYTPFLAKTKISSYSILGMMSWSLPNYISHAFKFTGKSIYIDTACSGASVALHQAKEALLRDESDYAIVGASNLLFGNALAGSYLGQESLGILGSTNSCYPFQGNAKGFLPAEATVTVLLKKLSKSVVDHDNIHGVILGSDINHTGGYGTLTMPSAESQASVIVNTYRQAKIDPATVTYIEAHGASSLLADAEEIKALKLADAKLTKKINFLTKTKCKISTLKPNIGHANSASGMMSLVRILHSLKNRKKLGIKDFSGCSDKIKLKGSRFYLDTVTEDWTPLLDSNGIEIPRRAAINNFGAGGVNAHLLLEEYKPTTHNIAVIATDVLQAEINNVDKAKAKDSVYFLALSVMHDRQFLSYAESILHFLQHNGDTHPTTLEYLYLTTRHNFDKRIVFRYTSIKNLQMKLAQFIEDGDQGYYLKSDDHNNSNTFDIFTRHTKLVDFLKTLNQDSDKNVLMELWVNGVHFPVTEFYGKRRFKKQSLPRYPFNLERYWGDVETINELVSVDSTNASFVHPLVHKNISNFQVQRYSSFFTGDEFFLADHIVHGQKVLPGVVYLELVRAAIADATDSSISLKNVSWIQPMVVDSHGLTVYIDLSLYDIKKIDFKIYSETLSNISSDETTDKNNVTYCHGQAILVSSVQISPENQLSTHIDISSLQSQCSIRTLTAADCYSAYIAMNIHHGPAYQGVESIYEGETQAIASIVLPKSVVHTRSQFLLHPSLMDSTLQIAAGLMVDFDNPEFALPFALESMEITNNDSLLTSTLPARYWVWARFKKGSCKTDKIKKINYDLCNEQGYVLVRLTGFSSRTLETSISTSFKKSTNITTEKNLSEFPSSDVIFSNAKHQETLENITTERDSLRGRLILLIQKSLAKLRKLDYNQIDLTTELSNFGLDSILLTEFTNQLNRQYRLELTPTVFFEHPTLGDFIDHLLDEHLVVFTALLSDQKTFSNANNFIESIGVDNSNKNNIIKNSPPKVLMIQKESHQQIKDPIAIVGMSGRFPMAKNLDVFWNNLIVGKDCISEIPSDRWDWQSLYGDPVREVNKSNIKWGGFIDGIDEFDPLFFGIAPKEAEYMDPQQRLLMTYVWSVIEDAGYSARTISGSNTAIFVGTGMSGYSSLISEARLPVEGYSLTGVVPSVGPNRMSFFLNIHGPSEPVETACSSSLIAIHRAVQVIDAGDCEQAIVGGINTLVIPDGYISFSKAGMLCQDGRCKTFSNKANGYVRGEGVGMLFIKKLSAAETAKDHIYGIIRATAENHGGRANSLTAPNSKAQTALLKHAYLKSGIDPRSVGYIEAHGTGTPLGDPIEINGLKNAFKKLYQQVPATTKLQESKKHCGLGSVKSNIGHLEMAAGIAGMIKVLLQLKNKILVKSLYSEQINSYIKLEKSPFFIVQENTSWLAPVDEKGVTLPRRAGISSFGFGGANAHIVIEEYIASQENKNVTQVHAQSESVMVVLSAKNTDRLKAVASNLLIYITDENQSRPELTSLAYTLQVGREAMDHRVGMLVDSIPELAETLKKFLAKNKEADNIFYGNAKQKKDILSFFTVDEDMIGIVNIWFNKRKYKKILDLWVRGIPVDWNQLYQQKIPTRISLPTYPFSTDKYWIKNVQHAVFAHTTEKLVTKKYDIKANAISKSNNILSISGENKVFNKDITTSDVDHFSYVVLWEESKLSKVNTIASTTTIKDDIILIVSSNTDMKFEEALAAKFVNQTKRLLHISLVSQETRQIKQDRWQCDMQDAQALAQCLNTVEQVNKVFFLSTFKSITSLTSSLEHNELQLLRLLKLLQHQLSEDAVVDLTILTLDKHPISSQDIHYYGAGVSGLAYSIAQGDHRFKVRNLDISRRDMTTADRQEKLLQHILNESESDRGEQIKFRSGRRYRQTFFRLNSENYKDDSVIKKGGVYLILGGSGTVGGVITRQLIQHYQAKVIWLGRQPESSENIQNKLTAMEMETNGEKPFYIQMDVTDQESSQAAVQQIKQRYSKINGAIFAGLVFNAENSISKTTEVEFWKILQVKTLGSFNFYQALQHETLDFLVYFSSSQAFSFSGAANLSAYAAGITFSDTLVRSLHSTAAFPIGIINWGFWQESIKNLPVSHSVYALNDVDSFTCFKRFISILQQGLLNQVLCLNASGPVQQLMNLHLDETIFLCRQRLANEKPINE